MVIPINDGPPDTGILGVGTTAILSHTQEAESEQDGLRQTLSRHTRPFPQSVFTVQVSLQVATGVVTATSQTQLVLSVQDGLRQNPSKQTLLPEQSELTLHDALHMTEVEVVGVGV